MEKRIDGLNARVFRLIVWKIRDRERMVAHDSVGRLLCAQTDILANMVGLQYSHIVREIQTL